MFANRHSGQSQRPRELPAFPSSCGPYETETVGLRSLGMLGGVDPETSASAPPLPKQQGMGTLGTFCTHFWGPNVPYVGEL